MPGVGVLGITPGDIFTVPAPFWQGQIPGVRVAALRVCFRWKDRVSAALAGQEMIAFLLYCDNTFVITTITINTPFLMKTIEQKARLLVPSAALEGEQSSPIVAPP